MGGGGGVLRRFLSEIFSNMNMTILSFLKSNKDREGYIAFKYSPHTQLYWGLLKFGLTDGDIERNNYLRCSCRLYMNIERTCGLQGSEFWVP